MSFLLLLPLLFAPPVQDGGAGAEPGKTPPKLTPAAILEIRLRGMGTELRLDVRQRETVRRVLEDEQLQKAIARASGAGDDTTRKSSRLAEFIVARAAEKGVTTSPKLPGIQMPEPPLRMHASLRGLLPETHIRILRELDLSQTQTFVQMLGAEGLVGLKIASTRTRLAVGGMGGKAELLGGLLAAEGGGDSPLAALFGAAGFGGPMGLEARLQAMRPPSLKGEAGADSLSSSGKKGKGKKRGGGKKKRRRRR